MKKHNFNAGPSILPREVIEKTAQAILDFNGSGLSLMEISHRAKDFQPVVDEAVALFKELLNIPEGYSVLFLGGGASMEFCMVPYNFLEKKAAREKILELRETAALEKETELNAKADYVKELKAKVEEIPTLIAAATEEGIKKGKADADKSNAFEVRALKKDAEYQKQLLEDKNERLAEDLANARAEKVELQQKLDDAYAQMRELAAKTVESTGGVKILNGQTQQNNK